MKGGCQCGAVRYEAGAPMVAAQLCHCRMCQRATGGLFAALATFPRESVRWTKGAPFYFASSDRARRGFCSACGTPLLFEYNGGAFVNFTIGSLDDPEAAAISHHYAVETMLPWLKLCDDLPRDTIESRGEPRQQGVVSYQSRTE